MVILNENIRNSIHRQIQNLVGDGGGEGVWQTSPWMCHWNRYFN